MSLRLSIIKWAVSNPLNLVITAGTFVALIFLFTWYVMKSSSDISANIMKWALWAGLFIISVGLIYWKIS
jgi:hypothetical protein